MTQEISLEISKFMSKSNEQHTKYVIKIWLFPPTTLYLYFPQISTTFIDYTKNKIISNYAYNIIYNEYRKNLIKLRQQRKRLY